jgi:hypothetical protein
MRSFFNVRCSFGLAASLLLTGCDERPTPEQLRALAPKPLPTLTRRVEGGTEARAEGALGQAAPADARRIAFDGERVRMDGARLDLEGLAARLSAEGAKRAIVDAPGEVFLAQLAPLLAVLEDAEVEVLFLHPRDSRVALPVHPWDEPRFGRWLDEPVPGRIRIVQRADGLELSTNIGKLLGPDRNGPSLPTRGGRVDLAGAREGLRLLKQRFPEARDACLVPSFGTEVRQFVEVLSVFYSAPRTPSFETICLVYPRPRQEPRPAGHH